MSMLTREQILAKNDHTLSAIEVPEWGGSVYVKTFSVADLLAMKGHDDAATAIAYAVVNENGERLFSDADIPALRAKSFRPLEKLWAKIAELNYLTAGSLEQAEKN